MRSALEYAPGKRDIEIELATALAAAGRNLEATAYFNSLLDAQPGNGLIHLQLARLAAKQGNAALAEEHYQRALDGTWQGDGYLRRLSVRLELAGYLISRKGYGKATIGVENRGGKCADVPETHIKIAGLMEQAKDPADALQIYRSLTHRKDPPLESLVGAGRTAYAMDSIAVARECLAHAIEQPEFAAGNEATRQSVRQMLTNPYGFWSFTLIRTST